MNLGLGPLFDRIERSPQRFVLATVIETQGSTYRKAGAMMLLGADGQFTGLVSGGCLETDLFRRAQAVLASGVAEIATYDLREDDPVWGLGLGCQGLVKVLLQVADTQNEFAGLGALMPYHKSGQGVVLSKTVESLDASQLGQWRLETDIESVRKVGTSADVLSIVVEPPPHLLICGAGPDAKDLVELAAQCHWRVTVTDHRSHYANAMQFPAANSVLCQPAGEGLQNFTPSFNAAVVMSHHLPSDIDYARALAKTDVPYIALLGPAARRREVLNEAEVSSRRRFFGPAGLDIGADLPATIGLAILAEAQAVLNGRAGGFLRDKNANDRT